MKTKFPFHLAILCLLFLMLPAGVFGCPNEEFSVVQIASYPGCCYEFNITETYGGDDYISNIVATINTPGVTFAGADGPPGYPSPTVTPASVTYNVPLHVDPCGTGSPLALTACFNNIPSTGASVTFTANATTLGYPDIFSFALGTVNIGTNAECAGVNPVQINCGDNITNHCTGNEGALVSFALPAATNSACLGPVSVSASWPSANNAYTSSPVSATFPIGVTPVTITAVDACGNTNTCTFTVTVLGYGDATGTWAFSDGGIASPPSGSSQQGNAIAVDAEGDSYVAGTFTGTATFSGLLPMYSGESPITLNSAYGPNNSDGFVAKYDNSGHLLWVKKAGMYNGAADGVAVDAQGNCFVTGFFQQSIFPNYGVNPSCPEGLTAFGPEDMFLAEYDSQGNLVWAVNAGDPYGVGDTQGAGVAVDTNGNCYVTGSFQVDAWFGNIPFDLYCDGFTPSVPNLNGNSLDQDAYLAKYDHWGNFLWATNSTCLASNCDVTSRAVTVDSQNRVWIVGRIYGAAGEQFGGTPPLSTSSGFKAFVARYDSSGNAVWSRQTTCATNSDCGDHDGLAIGADASGNCYFTAYFNGSAALGSLPPVVDVNSGSGTGQLYDYLVGSFDQNGNPRWLINGGQTNDDEPRGLTADASGNVYLVGMTGGLSEYYAEGQNIMLHKYSSSGALLWAETGNAMLTLPQVNSGRGVAVDGAGCVYVTGGFSDPGSNPGTDPGLVFTDFNPTVPLSAPGGLESIFVVKYCSSCSSSNSTGCVSAPANLVLWLPFDETNGNASVNLAASAYYGTQVNGPGVVMNAYVANSLSFNGVNQHVAVPDYPAIEIGTNDLTIDAWVNRATNSGNNVRVIVDKRDVNTGVGYSLSVSYGNLIFTMSGSNFRDTGTVPADGQWHFIAASLDHNANLGQFYVDGNATGTFTPVAGSLFNTNSLWVGASPLTGNSPWLGDLDEVEVFNRVLDAGELYTIFNAGPYGKCKPDCYLEKLTVTHAGTSIVLTWPGGGTLEQADKVTGPWTAVAGASSPYTVPPPLATVKFYKLECGF